MIGYTLKNESDIYLINVLICRKTKPTYICPGISPHSWHGPQVRVGSIDE